VSEILLAHWNAGEAAERAKRLRRAGHRVRVLADARNSAPRDVRESPPAAFVIDLSRLPAHGLALATWLRAQKATRPAPIVFVGGEPEKVERARAVLPDATYAEWHVIRSALASALRRPPAKPLAPGVFAQYAGRPLAAKLGIRAGSRVALLEAPPRFSRTIGTLPQGAMMTSVAASSDDLRMLFARTRFELARGFAAATRGLRDGAAVWIAWPKRTSSATSDLSQQAVREFGLGRGWVDYKICAVDDTWSALCFRKRRAG
jgi:CheY-like chemotaxis protein